MVNVVVSALADAYVRHDELSLDISMRYPVIINPPLFDGAAQLKVTLPSVGTDTPNSVGAAANPRGVAVTASLAFPAPTLVTARTRNW